MLVYYLFSIGKIQDNFYLLTLTNTYDMILDAGLLYIQNYEVRLKLLSMVKLYLFISFRPCFYFTSACLFPAVPWTQPLGPSCRSPYPGRYGYHLSGPCLEWNRLFITQTALLILSYVEILSFD